MKLRRLVTTAIACVCVFGATFGAYAMNMEKYTQGISSVSYDSSELAEYADQIAALVNSERAAYGLNPVKVSPKLSEAANTRARELKQSFSHTRPNGTSCFTAISELGITYRAAAENIAYGQKSPESVMKAWMNSSGHRANILNASMEYIGVGAVYNNGVYYWSQFFAVSGDLSSGSYLPGENYVTPAPEVPEETTSPEPEVTTAPEVAPEPEATTEPEAKPEPEVTTAPEIEPEPEVTTAPETKPEPEVTTAPEKKPEPEVTTAPEAAPKPEETTPPQTAPKPEATTSPTVPSEPEKTEGTPDIPCVPDCDDSGICSDTNGSISCTPETPCVTECAPSGSCPDNGNQGSSNSTPSTPNVPDATDCYPSGNCPTTGNQDSASCIPDSSKGTDCYPSGNCPTTGNQNSSSCSPNLNDILSSITGSTGSCPNNSSSGNQNSNSFGDILSWIGGSCNSSSGNSSGNCYSNNSSGNCNSSNGNSFVFGTQSSSGCPLTDILGSMLR